MSPVSWAKKWIQSIEKLVPSADVSVLGSSALIGGLLLAICLGTNIAVRLFPAYFPQLKRAAVYNVVGQRLQKVSDGVLNKTAAQPDQGIDEVNREITRDAAGFSAAVKKEYNKLKGRYQDPRGLTFFMEYDPFTWVIWTRNIVEHGHPGDKTIDGKSHDSLMLAPKGTNVFYFQGLFYLSAFLYKGVSVFFQTPLEVFLFYVPVFYAAVFLLLFYAFVDRWFSRLPAFIGTFFLGLTGICITHSSAGWYDFDMLSLILALSVAWTLLEAICQRENTRRMVLFSLLAAFFQGLYAKTWSGWWFMEVVSAGFFVLMILVELIPAVRGGKDFRKQMAPLLLSAAIFFVFSTAFVFWLLGPSMFGQILWVKDFLRIGTALSGVSSGVQDIWPNPYFTVIELLPLDFQSMALFFYGKVIFLSSLLGGIVVILKEWHGGRRAPVVMMACWFIFMMAASLKGNRFTIYLSLPLALFLGVFAGEIIPVFISKIRNGLVRFSGFFLFLLCVGLLVRTILLSGLAKAEELYPTIHEGWYKALTYVEKNSPKDAILNSWWDNGSWFRYYGKRRVIFDGATQNPQHCFWMAKALTEKDEEKAVAILRMLNNNSSVTYFELQEYIPDPFRCEKVLEDLLNSGRKKGEQLLAEQKVPFIAASKILDHLYDQPAPAYFIVEDSMLAKMPSISFLGNWDFRTLFVFGGRHKPEAEVLAGLRKTFGLSPDEARQSYHEAMTRIKDYGNNEALSHRYVFSTDPVSGKEAGQLLHFDNGVVYNTGSRDILFYSSPEGKYKVPRRTVLYEDGKEREIRNEKGDLSKTAVIVRNGNEYQAFLASDELAESLLVKLYFLGGKGLKCFKPFYSDDKEGIYIYEILWGNSRGRE